MMDMVYYCLEFLEFPCKITCIWPLSSVMHLICCQIYLLNYLGRYPAISISHGQKALKETTTINRNPILKFLKSIDFALLKNTVHSMLT